MRFGHLASPLGSPELTAEEMICSFEKAFKTKR